MWPLLSRPPLSVQAAAHRDLGRVLAVQRSLEDAETHFAASVRICRERLGLGHPNTACALTDLAAVQREQKRYEKAEEAAKGAVESLKIAVGPSEWWSSSS